MKQECLGRAALEVGVRGGGQCWPAAGIRPRVLCMNSQSECGQCEHRFTIYLEGEKATFEEEKNKSNKHIVSGMNVKFDSSHRTGFTFASSSFVYFHMTRGLNTVPKLETLKWGFTSCSS